MILILVVTLVVSLVAARAADLEVQTSYGPVAGYQYVANGSTKCKINAWKGIPFAAPPVGDLRWKSPAPPTPWTDVLSATTQKSACVQPWNEGSEDCLYLNVYSTAEPTDSGPYPVLYYIYGGGLMSGSTGMDFGSFLCGAGEGKGMIVVEVAYRLNIFGFLAIEELMQERTGTNFIGNYGIQDQAFGLQWTRDNIRNFGGNPDAVTIAGQSSGGTSVFGLLSSPKTVGLFHRAISLSGSPNLSAKLPEVLKQNVPIIQSSPCAKESLQGVSMMKCLRNLDVATLTSLIPDSWDTPGIMGLPDDPTGRHWPALVMIDGDFITISFEESLSNDASLHKNVPLMFGAMGQEPDPWPDKVAYDMSQKQWESYLDDLYSDKSKWYNLADKLKLQYANESRVNPQKAYDAIITDMGLACPNMNLVKLGGNHNAEIYLFVNQWSASDPVKVDDSYSAHYAYHTLDLTFLMEGWSYILNDDDDNDGDDDGNDGAKSSSLTKSIYNNNVNFLKNNNEPSGDDMRASKLLQFTWYNFISTGKPFGNNKFDNHEVWLPALAADGNNNEKDVNIYVIQPSGSANVKNYRKMYCDMLDNVKLNGKEFWWIN